MASIPDEISQAILSFGGPLIGFTFSSFLCGCMFVQMYIYRNSIVKDPRSGRAEYSRTLKLILFVCYLWLVDFLQLCFQAAYVYDGLISNYGEWSWFTRAAWSLPAATLLNVWIATPVQLFYSWRVYMLGGGKFFLPGLIAISSLASFGLGTATVARMIETTYYNRFSRFLWLSDTWLAMDMTTDILIVGCLYYYLSRGKTGFKPTDLLVNKLVFLLSNAVLLPTVSGIGHLVALSVAPNSFAHLTFNFITPKLYSNSFMATLNARKYLLESGNRDRDVIGGTRTPLPFATAVTFRRPTSLGFDLEPEIDSTAEVIEQNKNKEEAV